MHFFLMVITCTELDIAHHPLRYQNASAIRWHRHGTYVYIIILHNWQENRLGQCAGQGTTCLLMGIVEGQAALLAPMVFNGAFHAAVGCRHQVAETVRPASGSQCRQDEWVNENDVAYLVDISPRIECQAYCLELAQIADFFGNDF